MQPVGDNKGFIQKQLKNIPAGKARINFAPPGTPPASLHGRVINTHRFGDRLSRFFTLMSHRCVEVVKDDKSIIFDIESLTENLHITKDQILDAASQGNEVLIAFINKSIEHEQLTRVAISIEQIRKEISKTPEEIYKSVLERFNEVDGQLIEKNSNEPTGLTPKDLKDAIEGAFTPNAKRPYRFWRDEKGKPRYIIKKLGKGAYSKVYLLIDINETLTGVFKNAKRHPKLDLTIKETKKDVQAEYDNLSEIHKDKIIPGIQLKPKRCERILLTSKTGETKERYGYIGYRYDGDYFNDIIEGKTSLEERLLELYQLLAGLKGLHEKGYLHGDIKPQNIFVKTIHNNKYLYISDLGGAVNPKNITSLALLVAGGGGVRAATPSYTLMRDLDEEMILVKERNKSGIIAVEQKRDVFSLGSVLYAALTGGFMSYSLDKNEFPVKFMGFPKKDIPFEIPVELKALLEAMLSANLKERPTAAEAFYTFDKYVSTNFPEIAKKFKSQFIV